MKQTTLLKSWSSSQDPCTSSNLPGNRGDAKLKDCINLDSDDDSDPWLVQFMEDTMRNYIIDEEKIDYTSPATSIPRKPTSTVQLTIDNKPVSDRMKCYYTYKPTSNDSKHIFGFDLKEGETWVYSNNLPVRDYQYEITKECLFRNTLVCLPTGLGKTLIASVVIYNFFRWYPQRKIVFMAPTRPLVTQQMDACYKITGIPEDCTVELTGSINPTERRKLWLEKRVFFLTPQVVVNDLQSGACSAESICCLVLDEAHKATGNYAYCQVVWELTSRGNRQFRILALTATPGSDLKTVQEVISNLLISHIELRNDNSKDIKKYSYARNIEKVVIPLGEELTSVKLRLEAILESIVNRLKLRGGIWPRQNVNNLSKFMLIKQREEFMKNVQGNLTNMELGFVQRDFSVGITVFHALELLQQHGLRPMFIFFDGVLNGEKGSFVSKQELIKIEDFRNLWDDLETRFRGAPDSSFNPMSTQAPFVGGHPKLSKLQGIIVSHFEMHLAKQDNTQTKVIIFSQFRESVSEIMHMLKQKRPLIRPMSFIGQASTGKSSKGYTQKDQMRVMNEFREGAYNTLVSTCIGEEGLDIGDVDLIICFDSQKSPIRMIQRMGRTGRKREGRVVVLLTEGKEERNYSTSISKKSLVDRAIIDNCNRLKFYPDNPHMVPIGVHPQPCVRHIDVPKKVDRPLTRKRNSLDSRQRTLPGLIYTNGEGSYQSGMFELTEEMLKHERQIDIETFNFLPFKSGHFVSLEKNSERKGREEDTNGTLVDYYHLNKHKKSTYLPVQASTDLANNSSLNLHVTSVLRLIEEHRRGKTNVIYHAMGFRSVDLDTVLSQVDTQPGIFSPQRVNLLSNIIELSSDSDFDSEPKGKSKIKIKKKSSNRDTVRKLNDSKSSECLNNVSTSPVFGVSQNYPAIQDDDNNKTEEDCPCIDAKGYIIGNISKIPKPPTNLETTHLLLSLKNDHIFDNFDLFRFLESMKPVVEQVIPDLAESPVDNVLQESNISLGDSPKLASPQFEPLPTPVINNIDSQALNEDDLAAINEMVDIAEQENIPWDHQSPEIIVISPEHKKVMEKQYPITSFLSPYFVSSQIRLETPNSEIITSSPALKGSVVPSYSPLKSPKFDSMHNLNEIKSPSDKINVSPQFLPNYTATSTPERNVSPCILGKYGDSITLFKTPLASTANKLFEKRRKNDPMSSVKRKLLSSFELPNMEKSATKLTRFADSSQLTISQAMDMLDEASVVVEAEPITKKISLCLPSIKKIPENTLFSSILDTDFDINISFSEADKSILKPNQAENKPSMKDCGNVTSHLLNYSSINSTREDENNSNFHQSNVGKSIIHHVEKRPSEEVYANATSPPLSYTNIINKPEDENTFHQSNVTKNRSSFQFFMDDDDDEAFLMDINLGDMISQKKTTISPPVNESSAKEINIDASQGFSMTRARSDSDAKTSIIKPPRKKQRLDSPPSVSFAHIVDSLDDEGSDDFFVPDPSKKTASKKRPSSIQAKNLKAKVKKPRNKNAYIMSQANFSPEEKGHTSDENSRDSNQDAYDTSFVDDEVEEGDTEVMENMQRVYLESVRSPAARSRGGFLIRPLKPLLGSGIDWIFSQDPRMDTQVNTYQKDSFCVSSSADDRSPVQPRKALKKKKKKKPHRRRLQCQESSSQQSSDSSSDDV